MSSGKANILILLSTLFVQQCLSLPNELSMASAKPWESNYRIPRDLDPKNYEIYLHPNLETSRFSGKVTIEIDASQPRDHFLAHIKYLTVTSTTLRTEAGVFIPIADAFEYEENEFWIVQLAAAEPAGKYFLTLEFNGPLDNGILGFYRSVYTDKEGKKHTIATSKFQPTYARRAFPCFDEPTFKSTFEITLVRPSEGYSALSNMPEKSSKVDAPSPGLTEVTFEKSVPMVTYLAIFVVSDFAYLEAVTPVHKIPFRVFGTEDNKEFLQYALDVGTTVTDYYQTYFDVAYPLPKLDMAAIPDYSSGATEHWGLITYRETNLIFDPQESSSSNQRRVADVIAHELAHQWFGNLMTVEWWNDLWLNEGFATYIEYKGIKSYETDWDTDSFFLNGDLNRAFDLDATLASHPIVVNVDTPDQINAVFDTIAYSKGSSVIRMMENFLGPADFQKGLHNFLVKYQFDTAITKDLFDELTAASSEGLDVNMIMDTWTRQKGFPVLELNKANGRYSITQKRFLVDPAAYDDPNESSPFNFKWEIPVTTLTSNGISKQTWFSKNDLLITIDIPEGAEWTKFNVGQFGYYRVNYPAEDWAAFSSLLLNDLPALSTSDRTSLLSDAFALAKASMLDYPTALGLTKYLSSERELAPWEVALNEIGYMSSVLYYTDVYPSLVGYEKQLAGDLYQEFGWEDEGNLNKKLLRAQVIGLACRAGISDCLETAGSKFLAWKNEGTVVAPNLRSLVYKYGMKTEGNQEVWDWMLAKYKSEGNAQEKVKLMLGLASINDPEILYNFIQIGKDESVVRSQDFFTLLTYVSGNRIGEPIVWDFFRNEWEYLVERFTLNDRYLGKMIATVTERFATQQRLEEMEEFFARYPEAGAGEAYRKIALDTVNTNIKFVANYSDVIKQWLDANTAKK